MEVRRSHTVSSGSGWWPLSREVSKSACGRLGGQARKFRTQRSALWRKCRPNLRVVIDGGVSDDLSLAGDARMLEGREGASRMDAGGSPTTADLRRRYPVLSSELLQILNRKNSIATDTLRRSDQRPWNPGSFSSTLSISLFLLTVQGIRVAP